MFSRCLTIFLGDDEETDGGNKPDSGSGIRTTGGNGNNAQCVVPYIYNGASYSTCITDDRGICPVITKSSTLKYSVSCLHTVLLLWTQRHDSKSNEDNTLLRRRYYIPHSIRLYVFALAVKDMYPFIKDT